jgi:hypothetical protein
VALDDLREEPADRPDLRRIPGPRRPGRIEHDHERIRRERHDVGALVDEDETS